MLAAVALIIEKTQKPHIECVCMDMSNAYGKWVRENLPGVPVIYDHFHVIKAIKQACGYRDFKYFRLKVFDLPNLKPPRPHAARGRATFPRTAGFCARERRWSVPNPTTFTNTIRTLGVLRPSESPLSGFSPMGREGSVPAVFMRSCCEMGTVPAGPRSGRATLPRKV